MNNKENQRYIIDSESMKMCLVFTPDDLDEDSHLLPTKILIPLSFGVKVKINDSNNIEYIYPESFGDKEIQELEKQIKEKFEEHNQFLNSLKPY